MKYSWNFVKILEIFNILYLLFSSMAQKKSPSQVTFQERTLVWQIFWNMTVGSPEIVTRHDLQQQLGSPIPQGTTLGCLKTFRDEKYLMCVDKNNQVIPFSLNESDYNQFCLTSTGTKIGPLLPQD
jgi:hypothetical protein